MRGHNPDRSDAVELPDPDPQTWRKLELRMEHKPGRFVEVVLIRPLEWLEEEGAAVGELIWLDLPEMHSAGEAEVLSVSACPELEPGQGPDVDTLKR